MMEGASHLLEGAWLLPEGAWRIHPRPVRLSVLGVGRMRDWLMERGGACLLGGEFQEEPGNS